MGISSSSAKTVISNAEIRSQLINGTFPAITEPVRTADSNVPAISAEHATGLMNIMSSMLIADEISRMDVRFKEEPDDVMLRAGELVMRSHMNMVSIYPVMVDVNDPATIPVHGQATMNPEHMDDVMSSVELSGIMHAFSDSGSNVWATRYRSSPKPYDASQVANLRQEILFTDVIKGAGHGYNDATWLKAQSTLLNSIEENNGGYWRTEGDYVMEDYGAGRFADLAYGYFQKATGITSGKLQGLCRDLLGGGTGSKREGIAASVYKYMYGIDDSPEGDGYNRIWIQSGADAGDGMPVDIRAMNATILGIADLDVSSEGGATDAIDTADVALQKISSMRSLIGAQQNRLEHTIANQKNIIENTQHAESVIRDTDMAEEMVRFSKESILQQAGQSMLAQANHSTEGILALLR
ncbi:MAG: hypothetical protein E7300_11930 [Lachnospiraceae bacterium]|nr:hypothetical protein [Lachnospiraceae bacterium]